MPLLIGILTNLLAIELPMILLICLGVIVLLHLILLYPLLCITAYIVYLNTMVRKTPKTWGRDFFHEDEESCRMRDEGLEWAKENAASMEEVHIVRDGLHLWGEYYDFGHDRAVIIIPGRTDNLRYSYYFASPYQKSGYNVLCIDQRAHGKSDGKYNTLGFEESLDVLQWAEMLHREKGVQSILLHGICIGSVCGLFALTSERCPAYLSGLVADGMYETFYENYYLHMKDLKKPTFIIGLVEKTMKRHTGYSFHSGARDKIGEYRGPLLMLHGTCDRYALPEKAKKLYDACPAAEKRLVWIEDGHHSKLRILRREIYDSAIESFLDTVGEKAAVGA